MMSKRSNRARSTQVLSILPITCIEKWAKELKPQHYDEKVRLGWDTGLRGAEHSARTQQLHSILGNLPYSSHLILIHHLILSSECLTNSLTIGSWWGREEGGVQCSEETEIQIRWHSQASHREDQPLGTHQGMSVTVSLWVLLSLVERLLWEELDCSLIMRVSLKRMAS